MRTPRAILKRTIINSLIPGNRQTGKVEVSQTNGTDSAIDPGTAHAIANNAARRIPSATSPVSSNRDYQI